MRRPRTTRSRLRSATAAPLLALAGLAVGAAFLRDRRRRHVARDRAASRARAAIAALGRGGQRAAGAARGAAFEATAPVRHRGREYDDVTLARKVESEIFRPADVPKGAISVSAHDGVVELRGEVKRPEDVKALGEAAAKAAGVREVHNLLHTPGSPPKHSPASDPEEVRARARSDG